VRHDEVRLADLLVCEQEQVDIESAGPVADGSDAARRLLDLVRQLQELMRAEISLEPDDAVEETLLALGAPRGAVS